MKKQILAIAVITTLISLSGCGRDIVEPAVQQEATSAVTTEAAAETTTVASAETEETSAASETVQTETTAAVMTEEKSENNTESVKASADDLKNIIGTWYEADVLDSRTLTVNSDGTYELAYRGGGSDYGVVKISKGEHPDGSADNWYDFYRSEDELWAGFPVTDEPQDDIYSGQDGAMHFIRASAVDNDSDDSLKEYIGTWQCDRCSISISDQYVAEVHWADSASEDNVWTYSCICSPDHTFIECNCGGTLVHVVTDETGSETRTEVYNDGTAKFSIRGGILFWQDGKEDRAQQMGFNKIG